MDLRLRRAFRIFTLLLIISLAGLVPEAHAQTNVDWRSHFGQGVNDGGQLTSEGVHAAVEGPDGEMYVGGTFTTTGTIEAEGLAMWDGTQWHNIGAVRHESTSNSGVYALMRSGDILFVGGKFTEVIGPNGTTTLANNVAVLDLSTSTWTALEDADTGADGVTQYPDYEGRVSALAVDGSTLYVGGYFEAAAGYAANNVAKWNRDDETWDRLHGTDDCNGMTGSVNTLVAGGGALYAGGAFTYWEERYYDDGTEEYQCRDTEINRAAQFSGGSWSALGGGVGEWFNGDLDGVVFAMTQDPVTGDLYVGGEFSEAFNSAVDYDDLDNNDYVESNNVARWDGSEWHALGGGTQSPQYAQVGALLLDGSDLYVGGNFEYVNNTDAQVEARGLALWDGTEWPTQEGEGTDAWGNPILWTTLGTVTSRSSITSPSGGDGVVRALAHAGGDVYIGGHFTDLYAEPDYEAQRHVLNISRWDGSDYYALGTALDGAVMTAVSDGEVVYMAGDFEHVLTPTGNTRVHDFVQYDKTNGTLSRVGDGIEGECTSSDPSHCDLDIYAADIDPATGDLYVATNTDSRFFRWDGSSWTGLDGLSSSSRFGSATVRDLVVDGGSIYLAGDFEANGEYGIAQWDLDQEAFVAVSDAYSSSSDDEYDNIAVLGDDLYLIEGVSFYGLDLTTGDRKELAELSWSSGFELVAFDGEVYVSGPNGFQEVAFEDDEGNSETFDVNHVAAYDPDTGDWSALDGGMTGLAPEVVSMAVHGDRLYVTGDFEGAGGQSTAGVAAWNPTAQAWSTLGSGIGNLADEGAGAIASSGDEVYVGGVFTRVGDGTWTPYLAAWYDPVSAASDTQTISAGDPEPVDFPGLDLRLDFTSLNQDADVTVERSFDVPSPLPSGREIALGGAWTVGQTGASSFDADVCFYLDALTHPQNNIDFSALEAYKREAADDSWQSLTVELRPDADDPERICAPGVTGFGEFIVAAEPGALPVELAAFEATQRSEAVLLTWQTASETDNAGFSIERSVDDTAFTEVDFVEGRGTTTEVQTYRFEDADLPYEAKRVTYRLKQVDTDGATEYSPEVEVDLSAPERFALHGNYPNPFARQTTIRYELPRASDVRLAVYDLLGRRVAVLADGPQEAGRKVLTLDAHRLPSGIYFVRLQADGHIATRKVTVVR